MSYQVTWEMPVSLFVKLRISLKSTMGRQTLSMVLLPTKLPWERPEKIRIALTCCFTTAGMLRRPSRTKPKNDLMRWSVQVPSLQRWRQQFCEGPSCSNMFHVPGNSNNCLFQRISEPSQERSQPFARTYWHGKSNGRWGHRKGRDRARKETQKIKSSAQAQAKPRQRSGERWRWEQAAEGQNTRARSKNCDLARSFFHYHDVLHKHSSFRTLAASFSLRQWVRPARSSWSSKVSALHMFGLMNKSIQ